MPQIMTALSKLMSAALRHKPEVLNLELDSAGWVRFDTLCTNVNQHNPKFTKELVLQTIEACPKKRFELSADGLMIRACQGHSVDVQLGLAAKLPPLMLYHGTVDSALPSIMSEGLSKRARHAVHLSQEVQTARVVGSRRSGTLVVLQVDAMAMVADGYTFEQAANGVWLVSDVPAKYLTVMAD